MDFQEMRILVNLHENRDVVRWDVQYPVDLYHVVEFSIVTNFLPFLPLPFFVCDGFSV